MSTSQTLSIIIPAYNEEKHLEACLDSIAKQTVAPFEVIVVDNNSSDKTVAVTKAYSFATVMNASDQGVVHARNKGFDAAKGQIIGRIDADSILPANWVEKIHEFYADDANKNVAFTGGGHFYNVPLPNVTSWVQDQVAFRLNRLLMGHYILYGSNMAIPKKIWEQVRAQTCIRTDIHEDLDLAIHVHRAGIPISYHAGVQVGVKMRRVFNDYSQLWGNMMMWPKTLQVHGLKRWIFAWIGGYLLFILTPPILWPAKILQKLHSKMSG